jgi:hypothetical protein
LIRIGDLLSLDTDTTGYPHYPRPWSHAAKVEYLMLDLVHRGISPHTGAPPAFRFLWKIGLQVPPPLFIGFAGNTILLGTVFGFVLGLLILCWEHWALGRTNFAFTFLLSALAGLSWGFWMAAALAWYQRRLKLDFPRWRDYPEKLIGDGSGHPI